jgi:hypothetical protein
LTLNLILKILILKIFDFLIALIIYLINKC